MTFPLALLLPTVVADCDGILAGSECCAPEEVHIEFPHGSQDNMVKFGKVLGEGSHRYESCLNPAICEKDWQHFGTMKELLDAAVPLTPHGGRGAFRSSSSLRRFYDACQGKNGRMVQIDVNLQGAGECNMNHSGAFCSPFSCAVVFEKWILSAQYFVQHFPHCSSFALQPCVWQNAATMQRQVSLEALLEVFDVLEMVDEEVDLSPEVENLLQAIHHLGKDELISWQILRPFADANWYGQKQSLKVPPSTWTSTTSTSPSAAAAQTEPRDLL